MDFILSRQLIVGTHSLVFLLVPGVPEVLGALGFLWVQVFQSTHPHQGNLEGPKNHTRQAYRLNNLSDQM